MKSTPLKSSFPWEIEVGLYVIFVSMSNTITRAKFDALIKNRTIPSNCCTILPDYKATDNSKQFKCSNIVFSNKTKPLFVGLH